MKKMILLCLAVVLCFSAFACAEGSLTLSETTVFGDMPCSWAQGYEPVVTGDTLTLHVPLQAEDIVGAVKVALYADDETLSPLKTQGAFITAYRNDGGCNTTLKTALLKGRVNGDYPCTLIFTGKDGNGQTVQGEYHFVLHIRDGRQPEEILRPVISDVAADLRLGEDCTLSLVLTNPSDYANLTNMTLRVTDASGDILPAASDVLRLPDLMASEVQNVSIPLKVRTNAAISLHTLKFDLSWTALGADGTWTESFTLPVNQEIRLEQGGIQLASTILQGDMATMTLPLMNMGRADVSNVMVTLMLPGVVERQSVLVGTIEPGETKTAKLTFTPGKTALGEADGTVAVTCEDAWGNAESFTLPVSVTVEEAPVMAVASTTQVEEQSTQPEWLIWALAGGCGVLLLVCLVQGAVLRRKIRRMEEDRL